MEEVWYLSFLNRLRDLKEQPMDHLSCGSAVDFAAYQKVVGMLEGLNIAEREFKEALGKVDQAAAEEDFTNVPRRTH